MSVKSLYVPLSQKQFIYCVKCLIWCVSSLWSCETVSYCLQYEWWEHLDGDSVVFCSLYFLSSDDGVEGGSSWKHHPSTGQEWGHWPALPSHHIRSRHLFHHQVDGGRHRPHQEAEGGGSETGETGGVVLIPEWETPPVWLKMLGGVLASMWVYQVIYQTCM